MSLRCISLALVVLLIGAPATGDPDGNKALAAAHYKAGSALFDQGKFDEAFVEYEEAYQLAPRPLVVYHMARARQRAGKLEDALRLYNRYVTLDPHGKGTEDAKAQIDAIAEQLEARKAATGAPAPPHATAPSPPPDLAPARVAAAVTPATDTQPLPEVTVTRTELRPRRWPWLAAAAAAVVAGIVLDTVPGSASNHRLDALDFAPAGLYGASAVAAAHGFGWF